MTSRGGPEDSGDDESSHDPGRGVSDQLARRARNLARSSGPQPARLLPPSRRTGKRPFGSRGTSALAAGLGPRGGVVEWPQVVARRLLPGAPTTHATTSVEAGRSYSRYGSSAPRGPRSACALECGGRI